MADGSMDTIAAVATAHGLGAIAVLRVSGPGARDIAQRLAGKRRLRLQPRTAELVRMKDSGGHEVDQALLTFFPSPRSFTGEDVLEISCHGGYATVRAALAAVLQTGARPAEPGEFTRRAFLNGKMDLAQAEAVNQLIRARTGVQLTAARQTLDGALSRRIHQAAAALTEVAAALEASIDFPEDVDEPDRAQTATALDNAAEAIRSTMELAQRGQMLSAGIRMAIVGRPNVGKSSLLNLLSGRPRAIVSNIPGTTRDFLEETVAIGGLPIVAVDTAGIRETDDPVEREGALRAREALQQADVGLIVLDASAGLTHADAEVLSQGGDKAVAVWNKTDLAPGGAAAAERVPPDTPQVRVCALTGDGLAELEQAVLGRLGAGAGFFDEALAASERQVAALREALEAVQQAAGAVRSPMALDLAAVQIQAARRRLGEITGENVTETLIDAIFSSFCIGK